MNKVETKILKVILFIGVFAYLQYYNVNRGAFTIDSATVGIMMASAVYLLVSLFGIVLSLSRNYLIAIVGTAALALFLSFKLDEVLAKISLPAEGLAVIIGEVCAYNDLSCWRYSGCYKIIDSS